MAKVLPSNLFKVSVGPWNSLVEGDTFGDTQQKARSFKIGIIFYINKTTKLFVERGSTMGVAYLLLLKSSMPEVVFCVRQFSANGVHFIVGPLYLQFETTNVTYLLGQPQT